MTTTAGITTTFTTTQSDCYASFSLYSYLNNESFVKFEKSSKCVNHQCLLQFYGKLV